MPRIFEGQPAPDDGRWAVGVSRYNDTRREAHEVPSEHECWDDYAYPQHSGRIYY